MASPTTLEERFNLAVKTIQNLPPHGIIQPSNLTKLTFYGLYKQATSGPCKESRPSMFNVIARAKWEAWDRCRSMTREQAMLAYIDEIRKIVDTMPQTNEVLEFAKSVGLSIKPINDQSSTSAMQEKQQYETTTKNTLQSSAVDSKETKTDMDISKSDQNKSAIIQTSNENDSEPSESPSSSSSATSSDIGEFYDDPSWFISSNDDQLIVEYSILQQPLMISPNELPHTSPHQNRTKDTNTEPQRAILKALNKLQFDINNVLERLNQLETSVYLLQQRELLTVTKLNSSSGQLPSSGFRRSTIIFIVLWPFIVFILMRLFLRAKISIHFQRRHLFKA